MKLEKLEIFSFRNISEIVFEPNAHLNFFIGLNGQGKTSILEAISDLGSHRSFRGASADEWISFSRSESRLKANLNVESLKTEVTLGLQRLEHSGHRVLKVATLNGKTFRNSMSFLRQRYGNAELGFHSISFCPEDHRLIRGEPSERRQFIDRTLSATHAEYLDAIHHYRRLLEQRNAVLRDHEKSISSRLDLLASFESNWIECAAEIIHLRMLWIHELFQPFQERMKDVAPRQRNSSVFYISSCKPIAYFAGQGVVPSLDELKERLVSEVSRSREKEWRTGTSAVGPHRDDFGFGTQDEPLRSFGSQGEVRSAVLALKLAEIDLFRQKTGHRPVLLLDDFSSELDHERRSYLLRYLSESDLQVFVTTTEDLFDSGSRYYLSSGSIDRRVG